MYLVLFADWGEPTIYHWSINSTYLFDCATISGYGDKFIHKTTDCTERHYFMCESGIGVLCIHHVSSQYSRQNPLLRY